ncbi:hypothetical protein HZS38_04885 [Xenorhabdus nematophila]|nr:hypothetical protein [Xenorhabdus nematophila]KHD28188.1 hypothetical protein LH67_12470 [Xenorhabdus nematophila]MBA0018531.1 hypothetical protein [Xenorhabdus nematophila]CEF32309.1 conserved hypothetical protein [Xenorhabdus nematophila str. Websteri]CEK25534.1 conserved protein of unknown function [Xenorhabdus nematophila AN6/1]
MYYCHAFDVAFEAISQTASGGDVTPSMLRKALQVRLDSMSDEEIVEACGVPFDTYEMTLEEKSSWEATRGIFNENQ